MNKGKRINTPAGYMYITEAAKMFNIPHTKLLHRIATWEEKYWFNAEGRLSLAEQCRRKNISYSIVWQRLNVYGWPEKHIFAPRGTRLQDLVGRDTGELSVSDKAQKAGISYEAMYHRIYIAEWPERFIYAPKGARLQDLLAKEEENNV